MKASEILRHIADVIDRAESGQPAVQSQATQITHQGVAPEAVPTVDQKPDLVVVKVDNKDETEPNTMTSPLQQELEIMKKAAGIPSAFDGQQQ